jgi:ABC-type nitrate/sulfonate/bicarbonate transport system, ATPase component
MNTKKTLIQLKNISKSFKQNDYQKLVVLDKVNLELYEGEIVALLGRSGCGKSTLLRITSGLSRPSSGEVFYHEQLVTTPATGLAMVFQNFAIMPWLTVLENVELGLEARGIAKEIRRSRALKTIDIVGLDGFESAYPKELSGGMKQRVGLARALVIDPEVLLMDEAFSALDVLTADNLRSDLLDLWHSKQTNLKNILLVTHNINEAAALADRIIVLGTDKNIKSELLVDIPHPRNEENPKFRLLVDNIYSLMTTSSSSSGFNYRYKTIGLGYRLPNVQISEITGLLDMLIKPEYRDKKIDLPFLADELYLNIDDLFPITETLEILRFAQVSKGDIKLNDAGKALAEADILERKKIFADHLVSYVPLAYYIRHVLDERPEHKASEERFLTELEDYLSEEAARETLTVVIEWGRYAEIFAYDYNTGQLSLENPK